MYPPQGRHPIWSDYQSQLGEWADPSGPTFNGRTVVVYNITRGEYRVCIYANGAWRNAEFIG